MQVRLEVAHSKANVKRVVLRHDAVIGRSAECSLRIASSLVSRQHCQVLLRDGAVYVRDLKSSNGTFLNGTALRAYEDVLVPPGSELSVGGVRFYVRYDTQRPLPGPGSTVDLPGLLDLPADSGTTAEWVVKDIVPQASPGAAHAAQDAAQPVAHNLAPQEAAEATEAEPTAEALPIAHEAPSPAAEAPVAHPAAIDPAVNPGADQPSLGNPVRMAMPFSVPLDAMAPPSLVPADVPAANPDEEVVAHRGDEIDTLMIESEGPSETETIDAGTFRFGEIAAESFDTAGAADAAGEASSETADDKKEKKGLRSLFSLFNRKKVPQSEDRVSPADAAPGAAPPVPDDTVSEDVPTAKPAALAAPAGQAASGRGGAEGIPFALPDEEPIELLEAVEEAEVVVESAKPSGSGEESGFGDFLRQIGEK